MSDAILIAAILAPFFVAGSLWTILRYTTISYQDGSLLYRAPFTEQTIDMRLVQSAYINPENVFGMKREVLVLKLQSSDSIRIYTGAFSSRGLVLLSYAIDHFLPAKVKNNSILAQATTRRTDITQTVKNLLAYGILPATIVTVILIIIRLALGHNSSTW